MNTQVSKKSIMNNEMPHIINSILIQRTLLLCVALFILCTITRGIMVAHYLPMNLWQEHLSDFGAMWLMGAKLDMRSIGIALLIFVALHYITQSLCFIAYILTGGGGQSIESTLSSHKQSPTFIPFCLALSLWRRLLLISTISALMGAKSIFLSLDSKMMILSLFSPLCGRTIHWLLVCFVRLLLVSFVSIFTKSLYSLYL